ncbi:MAG TPA: hypothetical protein ENN40_11845 [Candidatus Aminicenantes bacterium]|nr:hypothetical protein [Candidatus Aminicenantes bacterium]
METPVSITDIARFRYVVAPGGYLNKRASRLRHGRGCARVNTTATVEKHAAAERRFLSAMAGQ